MPPSWKPLSLALHQLQSPPATGGARATRPQQHLPLSLQANPGHQHPGAPLLLCRPPPCQEQGGRGLAAGLRVASPPGLQFGHGRPEKIGLRRALPEALSGRGSGTQRVSGPRCSRPGRQLLFNGGAQAHSLAARTLQRRSPGARRRARLKRPGPAGKTLRLRSSDPPRRAHAARTLSARPRTLTPAAHSRRLRPHPCAREPRAPRTPQGPHPVHQTPRPRTPASGDLPAEAGGPKGPVRRPSWRLGRGSPQPRCARPQHEAREEGAAPRLGLALGSGA